MSVLIGFFVEFFYWIILDILFRGICHFLKNAYRFFFPLPAEPLPKKRKIRFDIKH
jgi:hypothetical protein